MTSRPEKAFVFAAGLGTRMRPLTLTLPKPLVQVGGKTMLDHMLDRLAEGGVTKAIVNVALARGPDRSRDCEAAASPSIKISDERALAARSGRRHHQGSAGIRGQALLHLQHRRAVDRFAVAASRAAARPLGRRQDGRAAAARQPQPKALESKAAAISSWTRPARCPGLLRARRRPTPMPGSA